MNDRPGNIAQRINSIKPAFQKVIPKPVRRFGKELYLNSITRKLVHREILPYEPTAYPWGVNLIGPVNSPTGLGQSFRLLANMIEQTKIPYRVYDYDPDGKPEGQQAFQPQEFGESLYYSVNIWHVNPSYFAQTFALLGQKCFDRRYNIAYWLWELEEFPEEWIPCIYLLNEIWTPSGFISRGIRKITEKPVRTVPYYVTEPVCEKDCDRKFFGLPENRFLFLMMYDARSIRERKNPEGAIQAFQHAFHEDDLNVGLVIKVNYADQKERAWLKDQIGAYQNIDIYDRNLEKKQVNSLIACVDAFVSLHRAEGFGLVIAEAMLKHVPVIATDWSANTEFMDSESSCMVGCKLTKLEKNIFPYKKGNRWAEPDLEEAAGYMRRLASDKAYYNDKAQRGYLRVQEKLGKEAAAMTMKRYLEENAKQ